MIFRIMMAFFVSPLYVQKALVSFIAVDAATATNEIMGIITVQLNTAQRMRTSASAATIFKPSCI